MDRNSLLNDPETAMRYALDGRQASMWTAMPAIVTVVNPLENTLEAQPAIMGVQQMPDDTSKFVKLPLLVDVPICFPSGGGFMLTLPLKPGDEVLIIIASRCIDSWWQSGGIGIPMELRMHDLSDGFAIPGPMSKPKVPVVPISPLNLQIRDAAGTTMIEMTPVGHINILALTGVSVIGPLMVTGPIIAAGGIAGAPSMPLMVDADIETTGEVTAAGIPLSTHIHSGVSTGTGDSGPPVP